MKLIAKDAPVMKCNFCESQATMMVNGFAEDGTSEGYVYQAVCDEHVTGFQSWLDEGGEWFDDPRLHGLSYITDIEEMER